MDLWPKGTLVLGRWSDGMALRSSCRDHLFLLTTDPMPVDFGCGWVQTARCLVCGPVVALGSDVWSQRPDAFALAAFLGQCQGAILGLQDAIQEANDLILQEVQPWETKALKNFD